jgi:hypothetical protein
LLCHYSRLIIAQRHYWETRVNDLYISLTYKVWLMFVTFKSKLSWSICLWYSTYDCTIWDDDNSNYRGTFNWPIICTA